MHRNKDHVIAMNQEQQQGLFDRMARRLYQIVSHYEVDPVEFIDAGAGMGYGLLLALPFDTFGSSKAFTFIEQFMSETVAGIIFFSVGLFFMVGIFAEHRKMRIMGSIAMAFCFFVWSLMLGWGNFFGMGWFIYGLMAVLGYWSFLRNCSRLPV